MPGLGLSAFAEQSELGQAEARAAQPRRLAAGPADPTSWTDGPVCTCAVTGRGSERPSGGSEGSAATPTRSLPVAMAPFQLFMYFLKIHNFLKENEIGLCIHLRDGSLRGLAPDCWLLTLTRVLSVIWGHPSTPCLNPVFPMPSPRRGPSAELPCFSPSRFPEA